MNRISKFLNSDEADEGAILRKDNMQDDSAVKIENASFSWNKEQATPTLQDVNIDIKIIYKVKGNVSINGSLAYVTQQATKSSSTTKSSKHRH